MGYESDVAICWLADDYEKFEAEFKNESSGEKWALFNHCDDVRKTDDGRYVITVWHGIKWYSGNPSFPEISWIEELHTKHTSLFIRIGEETEDIEIKRTELEGDNAVSFVMESHLCVARSFCIRE